MNQKNIFTVIAVILLLQGIFFYLMGGKVVADVYPNLAADGVAATTTMMKVVAMVSIAFGLVTYTVRNSSQVLWAYTIGFGLFSLNTLKDLFIDKINVPIPAVVIQLGITLICGYLWYQRSRMQQA